MSLKTNRNSTNNQIRKTNIKHKQPLPTGGATQGKANQQQPAPDPQDLIQQGRTAEQRTEHRLFLCILPAGFQQWRKRQVPWMWCVCTEGRDGEGRMWSGKPHTDHQALQVWTRNAKWGSCHRGHQMSRKTVPTPAHSGGTAGLSKDKA